MNKKPVCVCVPQRHNSASSGPGSEIVLPAAAVVIVQVEAAVVPVWVMKKELSNASLQTKETNLVATEERVIMQTTTIDLKNGKDEENGIKQSVRALLDSGSQRTYISQDITDKLKLTPIDKNLLTIYIFRTTKPKCIETPVAEVTMILKSGFTMKIKANVVPNITGTIEKTLFRSETIKQTLKQYELADTIPVKKESCNIDLLIGDGYYADMDCTYLGPNLDGYYLEEQKMNIKQQRGIP